MGSAAKYRRSFRPALGIIDRNRRSGVIDEELFAGLVLLAQDHIRVLPLLLIEFAETAVGVAAGVGLPILLPDQSPRQVRMAFFVELRRIGLGLAGFGGAPRGFPNSAACS